MKLKRYSFAGEGCSISGAQCVHGAVLSGQEQACKILQLGNVDINPDLALGKRVGIPADATRMDAMFQVLEMEKTSRARLPGRVGRKVECSYGGVWNEKLERLGCDAAEDEDDSDSDSVKACLRTIRYVALFLFLLCCNIISQITFHKITMKIKYLVVQKK